MIWICTCQYYPEQYDIYKPTGSAIAYFRLRNGNLSVHPYKHREIDWNTVIYWKFYEDERGFFDNETEFNRIQRIVNFKIRWYLIKQWFKSLI